MSSAGLPPAHDSSRRWPRGRLILPLIIALAGVVRFWGLDFGLPHTEARPDESTLIRIARGIIGGDLHPHFFNYPTLYMYALSGLYMVVYALGRASGWFSSFDHFLATWTTRAIGPYLVSRALSATLGAATVHALYMLGRRLCDRRTAIVAAVFLALAFLHVRDSHFGVTDVPMTFMTVWAIFFLLKAFQGGRPADFVLGGLFSGLATSLKYNAALLIAPMLVIQGVSIIRGRPPRLRGVLTQTALLFVPFVLAFVAGTPFALLDPHAFWKDFQFERLHMQRGHGPSLGPGWVYHLSVSLAAGLGWPLLGGALVGLVISARRYPIETALVWSFPLVYYAVAGSGRVVFVRYMVPLVPFFCLSAAIFATAASEALSRRLGARRRDLVLVAVCALLVVPSAARVIAFDRLLERRDSRLVGADWLQARIRPGASVYQTGSRYGEVQLPIPLDYWTFDDVTRRFEARGAPVRRVPDWIVVQRSPIAYYSQIPEGLDEVVHSCYRLAHTIRAMDERSSRVYDQQDAFFLPLVDLSGITRPGPNISIYRRHAGLDCARLVRR